MKSKLLELIIMGSKFFIYGIILQIIFFGVLLASNSNGQNVKKVNEVFIDIRLNNASLSEAFKAIESKSNFLFSYDRTDLDNSVELNLHLSNTSVYEILLEISKHANLHFRQTNLDIDVKRIKSYDRSTPAIEIMTQTRTITGKVTSHEDNEGLPGVNVVEKGTSNGTVTDVQGNFSLEVSEEATLVFSSVGYIQEEVEVGTQSVIDLTMMQDIQQLQELVVIGFGTEQKKLVTGASVQVKNDDIIRNSATRVESALQGLSPGVNITKQSGQPGSGYNIAIRGIGSVNGSQPLVLINGVPGNLNQINPQDIESIDILKDAASAAIYGSRAANGVILVTTKRGKAGEMKVTYNGYYGISNAYRKMPMLNAPEYASILNESAINSGQLPFFSLEEINNMGNGTDWQEEIYNENAPVINNYINIAGGNENSIYSLSLSHMREEGIISFNDNSNQEQIFVQLNSTQTLGNNFKVGENITFNHRQNRGINVGNVYNNTIRMALQASPLIPVYDESRQDGFGRSELSPEEINPIAAMYYKYRSESKTDEIIGNLFAEWEIIDGLKLRSDFGANLSMNTFQSFTPEYELSSFDRNAITTANQSMGRYFSLNWDNTLTYEKAFDKHNFIFLAGMNAQDNSFFTTRGEKEDLLFDDFDRAILDNGTNIETQEAFGSAGQGDSRYSVFGRVTYNYDEKYLLSAILRRDGSSRFGSNNRFGYFPSVSAGWVMTGESFMADINWLDFLKVRASWGQNGQEPFDQFVYMATIATNNRYYFLGDTEEESTLQVGASPDIIPNPDLKWEASTQTNIGFDATFLNNFDLTIDLYNKTSRNWIVPVPIAAIYGISDNYPYFNGGNATNRGVEMQLGYFGQLGELKFDVSGNLSINENEVTDIPNVNKLINGNGNSLFNGIPEIYRVQEGFPMGYFWGFQTDGLFQSQADIENHTNADGQVIQPNARPGDIRFVDNNGDGILSDEDKTMIGDPNPDMIFGMNLSAEYKGFDFTIVMAGQSGNQIARAYRGPERFYYNYSTEILDRWTGPGTSNRIPRMTLGNDANQNWVRFSDIYVHDAGFARLKSLMIGYDLTRSLLKGLPAEQVRIYFWGNNLFTLTNYSGLDPEVGYDHGSRFASGIDIGFYPVARTYQLGLNVKF
ncbi:MAG: SusC/RagA family TonB-linked outer membrane protein [Cyclobacteriaceae bacterium]